MIEFDTRKEVEVIDLTPYVEKAIKESSIEQGICLIYTLHTTTGIVVNEAEPGLIQDLTKSDGLPGPARCRIPSRSKRRKCSCSSPGDASRK